MFNHLQDLLAEIHERNQSQEVLAYEEEFLQQIRYLSSWEKIYVQKKIFTLEWQQGSPHLFAILQREGMFNISLYLTSIEDNPILILNDMLEVEHSLLAEVILAALTENPQSEKLMCLLEKCCESVLRDLLDDPELRVPNYLDYLEQYVQEEELQHFRKMHLEAITLMEHTKILDALRCQRLWAQQEPFEANQSLKELMGEATKAQKDSLDLLLNQMTKTNFSGWKYSLGIFGFILKSSSPDDQLHVKKYLDELFWKACVARNEQQFQIFILLMRQTCYAKEEKKEEAYTLWYKGTISEMNYKIQPEDFREIFSFFTNLIRTEEDTEFLDIHIRTAVPAPARCNDIVQDFKQISRIRRSELEPQDDNCMIVGI